MSEETNHTRRRALQSICSVAIVGLAGCTSGSSESAQQPAQTATETSSNTATPERTATEAPESAQFVENPEEIHPALVEATSVPSDEVLIGFRLEDSSLPFTTEVYHAPDDAEIQATKTYDTQELSQVGLVPDPPRALDTVETDREDVHYGTTTIGEPLTVTLVARHDGDTFDWSAWSRTGYPHDGHDEANPALKVDCYCGGMIYTAPGGGTWARVIQVTPTERVDPGTTIALNWTSSRA
ncbi:MULTISPECIES: hypothetical protein [Haloarcula]|uniref:Uncharacterized protein n=1 Tax=Haloarcula pellucida TaxID=1427151 RepID=A0A830GM01_9EURY|nr:MULTISPECIES: hypothetical protein [Halomicroarcula]MBX0348556.1 hypothetical protein [Halomicroarcula pellucida]MDS0278381.1 hypothetical protein [Halomicroarcula sp. S1AR25-4]GGN92850.1 hypothetical protein GCM10009030_17530 [Halomicroarcula pellucida]